MKLVLALVCSILLIALVYWTTAQSPQSVGTQLDSEGVVAHPFAPDRAETQTLQPLAEQATSSRELVPEQHVQAKQSAVAKRTGRLALSFVDKDTEEPIPDLRFAVYTEQPKLALIELGTTDADGRARIDELELKLIIVETVRAPPYAVSFAAAWLADDPSQELTVRVSKGGAVTGRIINDLAQPVPDISVFYSSSSRAGKFWREAGYDPKPVVLTNEAGEYGFEAVVSSTEGIWLTDGEVRPETWKTVSVYVKKWDQEHRAQVDDGALVQVPDIVVNRRQFYNGYVTDSDGIRVAGALVSANIWRKNAARYPGIFNIKFRAMPDQPKFELLEDETLSNAGGDFELALQASPKHLTAWAPGHAFEAFEVDSLKPGEHSKPIELRLSNRVTLTVELLDAEGNRITEAEPTDINLRQSVLPLTGSSPGRIQFAFLLKDGTWHKALSGFAGDGLIRPLLDFSLDQIERMIVYVHDSRPVDLRALEWMIPDEPLRIQLTVLPRINIQLNLPELEDGERFGSTVIHACTLARSKRNEYVQNDQFVCCGLGTVTDTFLSKEFDGRRIAIPVFEDRPYEVSVYSRSNSVSPFAIFGPFYPSEEIHQIDLDRSFIQAPREEQPIVVEAETKLVPQASIPSDQPDGYNVSFRIVDALTNEAIPRVSLVGSLAGSETPAWIKDFKQSRGAKSNGLQVPAGKWAVRMYAPGYEPPPSFEVTVTAGLETKLGTIELVPFPTLFVQFRNIDNSIPAEGSRVNVLDGIAGRGAMLGQVELDSNGQFELQADLPQKIIVELLVPNQGHTAVQSWLVPNWIDGALKKLRLSSWTDLTIRIQVPVDYRYTQVAVRALPIDQPVDSSDGAGKNSFKYRYPDTVSEDPPTPDGLRTFHIRIGAGTYLISAVSALFGIESKTIIIDEEHETQSMELGTNS